MVRAARRHNANIPWQHFMARPDRRRLLLGVARFRGGEADAVRAVRNHASHERRLHRGLRGEPRPRARGSRGAEEVRPCHREAPFRAERRRDRVGRLLRDRPRRRRRASRAAVARGRGRRIRARRAAARMGSRLRLPRKLPCAPAHSGRLRVQFLRRPAHRLPAAPPRSRLPFVVPAHFGRPLLDARHQNPGRQGARARLFARGGRVLHGRRPPATP